MITSIEFSNAGNTSIKVTHDGNKSYHTTNPCKTWRREEIDAWIAAGNVIETFPTPDPRIEKRTKINACRDALQFGVFTDSNGHRYDVDEKSRLKMTGVEAKIANGLDLGTLAWRDADNIDREHDKGSFLALTTEILLWTQALHDVARTKKAELDALSDSEVETYDAASGWPE